MSKDEWDIDQLDRQASAQEKLFGDAARREAARANANEWVKSKQEAREKRRGPLVKSVSDPTVTRLKRDYVRQEKARMAAMPAPLPARAATMATGAAVSTVKGASRSLGNPTRPGIFGRLISAVALAILVIEIGTTAAGRNFNWKFGQSQRDKPPTPDSVPIGYQTPGAAHGFFVPTHPGDNLPAASSSATAAAVKAAGMHL